MRILKLFLMLLILIIFESAVQAEVVDGSRVNMERPDGFEKSPNFAGFQNTSKSSCLMVSEIPGPYAQIAAGFSEAQMATRGMKIISKVPKDINGLAGVLVELTQTVAGGTEFHKWILVFGDNSNTILVTAVFPELLKEELSEKMKKAVLSTNFDNMKAIPLRQNDLNYSLSDVPGLKLAGRVQNTLIFNPSGILPKKRLKDSAVGFVAAQSLYDIKIDNRSLYARRRLRQSADLINIQIVSENDISIANLPGREIIAIGESKNDGSKLFVYQVMLFGPSGYFIMQGNSDASTREFEEPIFKAIARTFKLK